MEEREVCAFTIACGEDSMQQAERLRDTFLNCHDNIPFFIFTNNHFPLLTGQTIHARVCEIIGLRAIAGFFLSSHFKKVIYLDADIVVFSRLDALIDSNHEIILTNDRPEFEMGPVNSPKINSGVLAASDPQFWIRWAEAMYGTAFPVFNWLGDQFALRLIAKENRIRYHLLPEFESAVCYNAIAYSHGGNYHIDDSGRVRRGDLELKAWHWAGQHNKDLSIFPPQIIERIEQCRGCHSHTIARDNSLLAELKVEFEASFFQVVADFFHDLPLKQSDDPWLNTIYASTPGITWTYATFTMEDARGASQYENFARFVQCENNNEKNGQYCYYLNPDIIDIEKLPDRGNLHKLIEKPLDLQRSDA